MLWRSFKISIKPYSIGSSSERTTGLRKEDIRNLPFKLLKPNLLVKVNQMQSLFETFIMFLIDSRHRSKLLEKEM